jgi:hypothetical protein
MIDRVRLGATQVRAVRVNMTDPARVNASPGDPHDSRPDPRAESLPEFTT